MRFTFDGHFGSPSGSTISPPQCFGKLSPSTYSLTAACHLTGSLLNTLILLMVYSCKNLLITLKAIENIFGAAINIIELKFN